MTKLSQLKIDPEFQNQINPPSFEETHQLEMNILKEERVLNPIITWNGYIVDGHTAHARIYDRLLEMCVPISCIGVSLRKENAQEKLERLKLLIG